ncbi:hypothetical protein Hanom_Chr06g00481031 [Helianthus anomalus]
MHADAGKTIERERERVFWVGSIPISTNHTFFFFKNSLPLHEVSKPLPTLLSIVYHFDMTHSHLLIFLFVTLKCLTTPNTLM